MLTHFKSIGTMHRRMCDSDGALRQITPGTCCFVCDDLRERLQQKKRRRYSMHARHVGMRGECAPAAIVECLTVASGIFAMLGVASHLSVAALESFASTFHMPIVVPSAVESPTATSLRPPGPPGPPSHRPPATPGHPPPDDDDDDDHRPYAIYVRPAYDNAIFALVRHFHWKHFYYLYDTEQGHRLASVFLDCFYGEVTSHSL